MSVCVLEESESWTMDPEGKDRRAGVVRMKSNERPVPSVVVAWVKPVERGVNVEVRG